MAQRGTVQKSVASVRPRLDAESLAKIRPTTLSLDRIVEVPDPLRPLFPAGGVQRGWNVGLDGHGSWGVGMSLLANGLGDEGWVAIVGLPTFSLVAAASYGLRLDRVIMVDEPGPGRLATVLATLLEAVDMVVLSPYYRVGTRDARRLVGRAREQETVLFHLDGGTSWPTTLNMTLVATTLKWEGLGQGHGHLRKRLIRVEASGRGAGAQNRSVDIWLPDHTGPLRAYKQSPIGALSAPSAICDGVRHVPSMDRAW